MVTFVRWTFWRSVLCFFIAIFIVFLFGALAVKEERLVAAMNQMVNVYPSLVKQTFISSDDECTYDYINTRRLKQDDPCIIDLIRRHHLNRPSTLDVPYNLTHPETKEPSAGQAGVVLPMFNNKTNGFFIECGAHDGEYLSNTLYMERYLNWNGILIEAEQESFRNLLTKKRRAWALPVCLSLEPYPTTVTFNGSWTTGSRIVSDSVPLDLASKVYKVQCFPLYSILVAVGQTTVDYFSLDVEGVELDILQTIPWEKVDIKILTVEWNTITREGLPEYMQSVGYTKVKSVHFNYGLDLIFEKRSK